jgi:hypothetical protein
MPAMYRVGIAVLAFFMVVMGVATNFFLATIDATDDELERPLAPPPDPVALHAGEEITWRGTVCDVWQGGCRLRQMVTGPDGKTRAIAPAILFANEKDWENTRAAWGQEVEVRGIVKGPRITEAELIGNESQNSTPTIR